MKRIVDEIEDIALEFDDLSLRFSILFDRLARIKDSLAPSLSVSNQRQPLTLIEGGPNIDEPSE